MGMLDFLKRDPEEDYDDFDEDLLDDDMPDDADEDKSRIKKGKKPLLRFSAEEEQELAELPGQLQSRFTKDYAAYLFEQAELANENLRRRTAEAYELIRQTAGQPLPEGYAARPVDSSTTVFEEDELENDAYIPGADEQDPVYSDEYDDDYEEFDDAPDFGEFDGEPFDDETF